jgi:hypothetical protein
MKIHPPDLGVGEIDPIGQSNGFGQGPEQLAVLNPSSLP